MTGLVRRRAVFFIGGYDPKTPAAFFERFGRELRRAETLWGFSTASAPIEGDAAARGVGTLRLETTCATDGWATEADVTFFSLDEIVLADFQRPFALRLWRYLAAFADFVASGVAWRFARHAWRFALYFLYPFAVLLACLLLGWLAGALAARPLGATGLLLGLPVAALALALAVRRWRIGHLMDLWSFSREHLRGRRPEAEALLHRYAAVIGERVARGRYDEVVLVGHSTGGMIMLEVAALFAALDRSAGRPDARITLLTLGSTALKAGYHPAARRFRERARHLVEDERIGWVEIQCLTDVINFYKTDPVREMGLRSSRAEPFPIVRTVKIKSMLQPDTYRRVRWRLFRLHYQYVFANTKPYWYDFFQVVCGPLFLEERARHLTVGSPVAEVAAP